MRDDAKTASNGADFSLSSTAAAEQYRAEHSVPNSVAGAWNQQNRRPSRPPGGDRYQSRRIRTGCDSPDIACHRAGYRRLKWAEECSVISETVRPGGAEIGALLLRRQILDVLMSGPDAAKYHEYVENQVCRESGQNPHPGSVEWPGWLLGG
jgi:hypothetical protein